MASFENHVRQAKSNLSFLKEVNKSSKFFDWQVTTCFYTAVHLVNAHLAKCADLHYRTHQETKQALNPHSPLSTCKIDEDVFNLYVSLEKLSRRSRYLCNENGGDDKQEFLTGEKHITKAITRLNAIMAYFEKIHSTKFDTVEITCPRIKAALPITLEFFPT